MALEKEKIGQQEPLDASLVKPREKRASQKEMTAKGRQAIIVLFLITVTLSFLFWLRRSVPSFFNRLTKPYQVVIEKGGESRE